MVHLDADRLIDAVREESDQTGIVGHAVYQPAGGPGSRLMPPTFSKGQYLTEHRFIGGEEVKTVMLDQGVYAVEVDQMPEAKVKPVCPYPEMLVFGVRRPSVPLSGGGLLAVTEALRQAVMSRVPNPLPPAVSGHEADGVPHVAYLALLDVGHEHADGHLLGVAVALPDGLSAADRRTVVRALISDNTGLRRLRIDRRTELELDFDPERSRAWGLRPERWSGPFDGTTTWAAATPVMFDRHPRRSLTADQVLAESLVTAGYPEPKTVEFIPSSLVTGGVHRPARGSIPRGRPMRRLVHCRVEFPVPVVGPVIAGSLRYLGCGLFVPERGKRADDE